MKNNITTLLSKVAAILLLGFLFGAHWGMVHQASDDSVQSAVITHLASLVTLGSTTTVPK